MDVLRDEDCTAPEVPGYDVGRLLGRGGTAAVWLVTERATGREFALKCFDSSGDATEEDGGARALEAGSDDFISANWQYIDTELLLEHKLRIFAQVLLNLLTNALKYTPAGGAISISWEIRGDKHVRVEVRDTGPGIPVEALSSTMRAIE